MCTILHLEQSEFFLKMARNLMEEKNCRYISASNTKEASSILRNNKVDIVITCLYPEGESVEDFIKEVSSKYEVPIFVVTSNNIDAQKKELVNLGVTEYILKSNFEDEIIKYINYAIKDDEYMKDVQEAQIAVVEDSIFERERQKDIFEKYNINNVDFYESGIELKNSGKNYDIYLVDIILKNEFGKDLIRNIRVNNIESIIIAVTALDNPKILGGILDAGANDIMSKPINEQLFMAKLKSNIRVYNLNKKIKNILDN